MSDENQATETAPEPAESLSLDEVYQKYDIRAETPPPQSAYQDATAAPQGQPQPHLEAQISQLSQQLAETQNQFKAQQQQAEQDREKRELGQAIERVQKALKLPEHKQKLVKMALASKYEDDPRFATAWDSRGKNPRAFAAVLDATIPEINDMLSVKDVDQIAINQLALDAATKGSGTDPVTPEDEAMRVAKMDDGEFDAYWHNLSTRGY